AEHLQKLRALTRRTPKRPPLIKENAPRPDRQDRKRGENAYRKRGRSRQETDDAGAGAFRYSSGRRLHEQGDQRASERAQTALRDISSAPLGQRDVPNCSTGVKQLSNLCYD